MIVGLVHWKAQNFAEIIKETLNERGDIPCSPIGRLILSIWQFSSNWLVNSTQPLPKSNNPLVEDWQVDTIYCQNNFGKGTKLETFIWSQSLLQCDSNQDNVILVPGEAQTTELTACTLLVVNLHLITVSR